ncbi:hypothetical protein K443DRAFT_10626 [Laccaria amethystina LaAM-08-1]|uniref:Uncharacterized protein n=1 Tax=Laccaria amethystina LaAM-08-1 TaxID=1095629 RepID=A0A0C9WVF0_9AGAR|nr:hypothetical protein K443DRAFT_10626 [Laccaria amethystina LaAM-08-1]
MSISALYPSQDINRSQHNHTLGSAHQLPIDTSQTTISLSCVVVPQFILKLQEGLSQGK